MDQIVYSTLWETHMLPEEFPIIKETRITMGKIEQAQEILEALGLPPAQQNEMAALTLLVLGRLSEDTPWGRADRTGMRVHDILVEIKGSYDRAYAGNTRETIRRNVLHHFEQAGLVLRNPDAPQRVTNSGLTKYILTDLALSTLRTYGTSKWTGRVRAFLRENGSLLEAYQKAHEQHKIPLQVADGSLIRLSPGPHNRLQSAIVREFGPRFAPGGRVLYVRDSANKTALLDSTDLQELGIPVSKHGKLPDVMLFDREKNWLFLVEAVTSHGPVSPKRHAELEKLFQKCPAARVYVTAFPDLKTFKKYMDKIAWETEVWVADSPSHMVHFNGMKFLGPAS